MTEGKRPNVLAALDEIGPLRNLPVRLVVRCDKCGVRIGRVRSASPFGLLWIGELGNRARRAGRRSLLAPHGVDDYSGRGIIPAWVDASRLHYPGECRCPRNSVDGQLVWAALMRRQQKALFVPPQQ